MQISNHESSSELIPRFPQHIHDVDQAHQKLVTIPKQRKRLLARIAIGTAAFLTPVGCIARTYTQNDWIRTMNNESDEMIEYAEGCDPLRSFDLQIQVRRLLYKELQHKNK